MDGSAEEAHLLGQSSYRGPLWSPVSFHRTRPSNLLIFRHRDNTEVCEIIPREAASQLPGHLSKGRPGVLSMVATG